MTRDPGKTTHVQEVSEKPAHVRPSHLGGVLKKQVLILNVSLKIAEVVRVKFGFHTKPISTRHRQERRQVELKMTNVSNAQLTAERGPRSKSPESSSCYFLTIRDPFQTERSSQASSTPLRNIRSSLEEAGLEEVPGDK